MLDRKTLKAQAKQSMRGRKPSVYLVFVVYLVIVYVLQVLSTKLQFPGMSLAEIGEYAIKLYSGDWDAVVTYNIPEMSFFGSVLNFVISLMGSVLAAGLSLFFLRVSRGLAAAYGELFDGFGIFFKVVWLEILSGIFISLWSMLFIIPGIVASYRYSMAIYILLDDPELSALECIRRSKEMTYGYKGKLFVLDLSFIGWNLLCAIPFVSIYVTPYYQTVYANYYNVLSGYQPEADYTVEDEPRDPWEL